MTVLELRQSKQFKKDLKKVIKQRKNISKLETAIKLLQAQKSLPEKNRDHTLNGNWHGYRECHIAPDWLLIYKIARTAKVVYLARTGSHSDLFT